MVLQPGDDGQHGHGVKLRQGAEQRGGAREGRGAALQAERVIEHLQDLFGQVHGGQGYGRQKYI